jgi:Rrf2 family protein
MIRIARQTDYAARLVLHLASLGDGASASIADISEQRRLPVPFVRRMVARLVAAGILATTRGVNGGVRLGRPAKDISLGELVEAMEGRIALNECVHSPAACPFGRRCPVQRAWTEVSDALSRHLASIRFDALAHAGAGHARAHVELRPRRGPRLRKGARSHG